VTRAQRVGVYNRYWRTGGGAETYGAAVARVLARTREVDLLGPDDVDLEVLAERLRLDLSGVGFVRLRDRPGAVLRASRGYDLFVNVSFMSDDDAGAPHNVYITHFPARSAPDLSALQRLAIRVLGPLVRAQAVDTAWGEGFYPREGRRPRYFWTRGDASFFVEARADRDVPVRMLFRRQRPADLPPAHVAVEVDGRRAAELDLAGGESFLSRRRGVPIVVTVPARPELGEVEVRITSNTFVPAEHGMGDDDRTLGVALTTLHTGERLRDRLGATLGAYLPLLYRPLPNKNFLDGYDVLIANSEFTQGWIRRWWGREAVVLYPPVRLQEPGEKKPEILGVGRFFAPAAGHSKKQLEMVEAFRALVEGGGADGWTLHLVGGCSDLDRPYLEQVRTAAAGLAVELHVDASGAELAGLYARASVFWHATGLGEHGERHPHRMEHFGISIVEAMSAGAVPVVLGEAGPAEIVEPGVSGLHFRDLTDLTEQTRRLIADPDELARLAQGARQRAEHFGLDAFADRLEQILGSCLS
jgi:glycosyltransferase involved in cell wall biosynthesis